MKKILITKLRNESTTTKEFRETVKALAYILAQEATLHLPKKAINITTPLGATTGEILSHRVVLTPILRSGMALLPAFLTYFPDAPVCVIGIRRDETTSQPHHYYTNMPTFNPHNDFIIILDPMLATGGTLTTTIKLLKEQGIPEHQIIFVGVISAPEGVNQVKKAYPEVKLVIAAHDHCLNEKKFIVPGMGDFGDRYFDTKP